MVATARDITERKKAENQIRNLNETLEKKVAEATSKLKITNKELAVHMDELEQFTYIASHDLQEPLRTLTNFTTLLFEDYSEKLDDEGNKYISFIHNAAERMRQLVTGLLEFSVLGKKSMKTMVSCNDIIVEVLSDLNDSILERNAKITAEELPIIQCLKTEFRLLLQNLIANAIKFTKPDCCPEIHILAERHETEFLFSIKDNGIGIDPKNREKIFIIFKRMHNHHEYKGVGIGLAHCKKIVELHGGKIWVESNQGGGSTFKFTIPD